jgi:uncharacterized Zn finger protein
MAGKKSPRQEHQELLDKAANFPAQLDEIHSLMKGLGFEREEYEENLYKWLTEKKKGGQVGRKKKKKKSSKKVMHGYKAGGSV